MPRRPAAWTILGVALHDAVMEWEKSGRQLHVTDYFCDEYDRITRNEWLMQPDEKLWILPPTTKAVQASLVNYRKRGIDQLQKYLAAIEDAPWEISDMEREFEIDLDGVVVRGGVDRILFYPGTEEYLVEDLKTGSPEDEDDKRQLAFYAFVARELWDIPVNLGRYWYTKVDRGSTVEDLGRFDKKFWTKTFADLDVAISAQIFLPNPSKKCGLCSVKPWCSTQGWLQIGEGL